jgi:multimeric flavodoxin WrbA
MKVLLLNGSVHQKGTTYTALSKIAKTLEANGIETEIFQIGPKPISDCLACMQCVKLGKCVIDDAVGEFVEKARRADGFVFGTPVYYAHPSGRVLSFLDRAFYSGKSAFQFKPGASVAVARRAGTTAAFDVMNKYFTISSMPVVSATYWNNVFGGNGEQALQDGEGMATMENIAKNMAWLLKCLEAGRAQGITPPEQSKERTNFIR